MEGFELITSGAWSIVPPLLALALALITKEVYSSLTVGIFAGMIIYQFNVSGPGFEQLLDSFVMVPQMMVEKISENGALLLFLALLGALTVVIAVSGGSRAYAEWVSKHIKNAKMAQILTAVLGLVIFIDDYFNCLTVGAVMRPITDRFRVSHEKLAWIIDSTAAPVCIIAPVSSWAVAVGGYLGEDGFNTFVASIPYNFYAILTIFFVFLMLITNWDFGAMRTAQLEAEGIRPNASELRSARIAEAVAEDLEDEDAAMVSKITEQDDVESAVAGTIEEYKGLDISKKGRVFDLVIPIVVLIVFSILGMLYVGGFFSGVDFATAVGEDPVMGLCIGACVALVFAGGMYIPRKLTTLDGFVGAMSEGVRSMVGAIMILVLAWSLGSVCRYLLGTGPFVSGFVEDLGVGMELIPPVVFIVSAFIAFAMGTSWGTVALMLPIVLGIFEPGDLLFLVAIGSTLAGAVYGDHVSPISDTTILSSAGAKCNHLRHVSTQLPYATTVMVVCLVCYVFAGFIGSPWIPLALGIVLITALAFLLNTLSIRKSKRG